MAQGVRDQIEGELALPKWMPKVPSELRSVYEAEQKAGRRYFNTWALITFACMFDLFLIPQIHSAPELVACSALLRLGVLTPCFAAFVLVDRRWRLGPLYDPLILFLAVLPIAISVFLCLRTTSVNTLSDIRATPVILLNTGVIWGLGFRTAIANAVISGGLLIAGVVAVGSPVVPQAELGSLIASDIIMATTVIAFALQIERRDRRVFLLNTDERMRREALAALNRGLLLENQTDALTGVANRRCFDETLAAAWMDCLKGSRVLSVIMVDVDHFKRFNDHYGHQGGDDCLRRVAAGGRICLRAGDLFARYGGEEFAVILPDAPLHVAVAIAQQIRLNILALDLPHEGAGSGARVTISLGVASTVPTDSNGAVVLVEAADRELYAAKIGGRNQVGHPVQGS